MPRDEAADTHTATECGSHSRRQTDKQAVKKCVAWGCDWKSAVWQLHNRVKCILRISWEFTNLWQRHVYESLQNFKCVWLIRNEIKLDDARFQVSFASGPLVFLMLEPASRTLLPFSSFNFEIFQSKRAPTWSQVVLNLSSVHLARAASAHKVCQNCCHCR